MKEVKRAAGYVRCSTEMQEDSPEQQQKEILTFASGHGYEIVNWYTDFGKSGTTFDDRPQFQKLYKDVEQGGKFDYVIAYDESRWGRAIDSEENTYWRVHFKRHGVKVVLVKTSIDPKNDYAPVMKSLESIQASMYSKNLSQLTLRGQVANQKYSNGGTAPYGYRRVAVNLKNGTLRDLNEGERIIRGQEKVSFELGSPKEVDNVRRIFDLRCFGNSYLSIAKILNDEGKDCPKRGRWRSRNQKWSTGTIKSILDNPAYTGTRVFNRNSMSKIIAERKGRNSRKGIKFPHWKNAEKDWTKFPDAHPAIVTPGVWDAAHTIKKLTGAKKANSYTYAGRYLLSGLIVCSDCGNTFQGCSTTAKGKDYSRYEDSGWKSKGICSYIALSKTAIERFVLESIKQTFNDPRYQILVKEKLRRALNDNPRKLQKEITELACKKNDFEQQASHLVDFLAAGSDSATVKERLRHIETQINEVSYQIEEKRGELDQQAGAVDIEERIREFASDFDQAFESASTEEKKMLLKKSIRRIVVNRQSQEVIVEVRHLPLLDKQIEPLDGNKKAVAEVATAVSSGDRT